MGVLKLLIVATPDDVLVVGDLLPALAGMAMGLSLLFDRYKGRARMSARTLAALEQAVLTWRLPLGFAGMALAAPALLPAQHPPALSCTRRAALPHRPRNAARRFAASRPVMGILAM